MSDYQQGYRDGAQWRNEMHADLRDFAHWLLELDEPGSEERRTVTLTQIINKARSALRNGAI